MRVIRQWDECTRVWCWYHHNDQVRRPLGWGELLNKAGRPGLHFWPGHLFNSWLWVRVQSLSASAAEYTITYLVLLSGCYEDRMRSQT